MPIQEMGRGLSAFPFPLIFPQDEHERLLIARLHSLGVEVERATELIGFVDDGHAVRATLRRDDGSQTSCTAAYLAGCDGARSKTREILHVGFPGGTYDHLFYVADVLASGPAVDGNLHVDLDAADFLAVFPMHGAGRVRLIGTVRDEVTKGPEHLTFEDIHERIVHDLRVNVERLNWFSTYRVHHRVAHSFAKGRVFLLGDAAHIHSPVGGQGMNTGIGDAVNLAWKLAAVLKAEATANLLQTYEPERIGFARRLVATTDRVFAGVINPSALARLLRTAVLPGIAPTLLRLPFIRRFAFRTVSQIGVSYHSSPLSCGVAGGVRGGDRLPWVAAAGPQGNYAALQTLGWQAHVYGQPQAGLAHCCVERALQFEAFPWHASCRDAGLVRGALYLVRPDGYVALADRDGSPSTLVRYFESRAILSA